MLRYLFCILLVINFAGAKPKPPVKVKAQLRLDTSVVELKHFNKASLNAYRADKDFHYYNGYYSGESLWTKFWRWFWGLFDTHEKQLARDYFIRFFLLALAVAALVFLVLKLIGVDIFKVLGRKSKSVLLPYTESLDDIYAIDLDAEITRAISLENYKLGVRLLYLRLLRQLSDAGLINWDIAKTNSSYIDELSRGEYRAHLREITRHFEYAWYGDFAIDATTFKRVNELINNFSFAEK